MKTKRHGTMAAACLLFVMGCGAGATHAPAPMTDSEAQALAATWQPYACDENGIHSPECLELARRYAAALPTALGCDPGETCAVLRPPTVSEGGSSDGPSILEGLCNCPVRMNGHRDASLDVALGRFIAAGCAIECCPCPIPLPSGPDRTTPVECNESGPYAGTCVQ
jgi:hypothetical protein